MAGLVKHYLTLVTSEHREQPKYIAMLTALLQPSDDIFALGIAIDDEFDIDLAGGKQEDVLGDIVNIPRTLPYQPINSRSPVMDNETYRTLLKAYIAKNLWKGGVENLEDVWQTLFGTRIAIQDNQDMTITVTLDPYEQVLRENIVHGLIIPKPQSVRVNFLANFLTEAKNRIGFVKKVESDICVYPITLNRTSTTSSFYVGVAMTMSEEIILRGE